MAIFVNVHGACKFRHCERSEAIQYRILTKYRSGLLHFVRNDSIYFICFSRDGITRERLPIFVQDEQKKDFLGRRLISYGNNSSEVV
ncbi:TPA: hypothetical protein KKX32_000765 [Legionella pneumophila]|uniref:hypothetical protein n=1 Tax=Legionella pneumophila TaxID=446 RepID=UPI0011AFEE55|nr:hypothetical protein [Legionella pneumophila]HAT8917567.1 hypothetical protein [Legionella pneumophila subsp. pneumophila]MBN5927799.1 hypothetical protein [Legionella pneumophila]HAT3842891.1 hypothetical protein [Legionella pneumophila]HAT3862901.1 hypothetical protein [Legionella pneumophila]HAT3872393.1 hypothetical protein [Legionella pneumophila]